MIKSLLLILVFNTASFSEELVKRTQVMMGTYVSLSLAKDKLPLSQIVFKRLKKVENALSSYDPQAQIYRLNHNHKVGISQDTYEALELSRKYYKKTEGYFDITIGSITKGLFHFGEEEKIPSEKALLEAKIDFKGLHFNRQRAWIDEGIKIDLGGMGKGFGVDKAKELLIKEGIREGIVSLSGDMFCLHRCEMSIQDPFSEGVLASFFMAQEKTSISTSGNYRRYVKNKKYNHLINPKTRKSQKTFASITLISPIYSNSDLDAYSTAASVMPKSKALGFLNKLGLGYLLVTNEKKIYKNEVFSILTQNLLIENFEGLRQREYIRVGPLKVQNSKRLGF